MKHSLLVIGNSLQLNTLVNKYIQRVYMSHFGTLDKVNFSPKNNTNLPFLIEELAKENDELTIFAHKESFSLVGKIVSTLSEDTLTLQNDTLIPSKALFSSKNIYQISLFQCKVNILHIEENGQIPKFLEDPKESISKKFHLVGLDDDSAKILLDTLVQTFEVSLTMTPLVEGWLFIEATSNKYGNVDNFIKSAKELFDGKIVVGHNPLEHMVKKLKESNQTISIAESCTGGLISSSFTKVSGVSAVLKGALVTYSNEIKSSWLGVDEDILKTYGAVSEETVRCMLEGCIKASQSNISIATSGIAGPDGGSESKPVGTVFVGVANDRGNFAVERLLLKGDREYIQEQSMYHVLKLLLELERDVMF